MKKLQTDSEALGIERSLPRSPALSVLRNAGLVAGIMALATFVSFGFRLLGFHEANYIMTYILGVLLVAYLTNGYLYGVISSVLGVLVFNFFFTEPFYTLAAYSPEYPVTFVIMLIAALFTSTLTARVKRESRLSEMREKRMRILYETERNLLTVNNVEQVARIASRDIARLFAKPVLTTVADVHGELTIRYVEGEDVFDSQREKLACVEAFQSGASCGAGTQLFPENRAYFHPITGQSGVLGVIGIAFDNDILLPESQRVFLDTVVAQIALVLERERLYEKQQQVKMDMERERLRGNLLRAISHDLRTPLTGILGAASTMLENYGVLDDDVRREFLQGIYNDADWLSGLVENILSMTRFEDGNVPLKKEMEAVEEIVAEAVRRVKKRAADHTIEVSIPKELIMLSVDGTLVEQVLVNLLDNAIKHTPEGSSVCVAVTKENGHVIFEVSDDGPGIPEKDIPFVFNRFYTSGDTGITGRRGIGLGLAICKSIVEAHGGEISAANRTPAGSVFQFTLLGGE